MSVEFGYQIHVLSQVVEVCGFLAVGAVRPVVEVKPPGLIERLAPNRANLLIQ